MAFEAAGVVVALATLLDKWDESIRRVTLASVAFAGACCLEVGPEGAVCLECGSVECAGSVGSEAWDDEPVPKAMGSVISASACSVGLELDTR